MENDTWQIDENLFKVHISSDIYKDIKEDFRKNFGQQQSSTGGMFSQQQGTSMPTLNAFASV